MTPVPVGAAVQQRLQAVALLPDLARILPAFVSASTEQLGQGRLWTAVCGTLRQAFPEAGELLDPFLAAWGALYATTLLLDALQDGDPLPVSVPLAELPQRYNLALSALLVATSLLDDLAPAPIPLVRLLRLRRVWADLLLCVASGQQQDLGTSAQTQRATSDSYQQIAQAKTGALFALALGGGATLLTDDQATITAFTAAGTLFGTLVQYSDDILDADGQANRTLTLPLVLEAAKQQQGIAGPDHTPTALWNYLVQAHLHTLDQVLQPLPDLMRQSVHALFSDVFGRSGDAGDR